MLMGDSADPDPPAWSLLFPSRSDLRTPQGKGESAMGSRSNRRWLRAGICLTAVLLVFCWAGMTHAAQVILNPSQDNTLYSADSAKSCGVGAHLVAVRRKNTVGHASTHRPMVDGMDLIGPKSQLIPPTR